MLGLESTEKPVCEFLGPESTMDEFWLLCLLQLVGIGATILALGLFVPGRIQTLIHKNSRRLNGTFSRRRYAIERASLSHCMRRTWVVMILAFVAINSVGFCFWFSDPVEAFVEANTVSGPNETGEANSEQMNIPTYKSMQQKQSAHSVDWNFTYIAILLVGWFVFAFAILGNLYRSAIKTYESHANDRFMNYYFSHFVHMQDELSAMPTKPQSDSSQRQRQFTRNH